MSNDALWLIELFKIQSDILKTELSNPRIRREKFDKFSYSAWAISETLLIIGDYSGYVGVGFIREVLKMQIYDYEKYYNDNQERHIRYMYAADMIQKLLDLTGGYIYD